MLSLENVSLMLSICVSKGIGYKAIDCRLWVVVTDGWMYGRQLSAVMINDRQARIAGTARFLPWLEHIMMLCAHMGLGCTYWGTCLMCCNDPFRVLVKCMDSK